MRRTLTLAVTALAVLALAGSAQAKPDDPSAPGGPAVVELFEQPTDQDGNPTGPKVKIKEENKAPKTERLGVAQVVPPGCKDVLVRWTQKDWTSLRTLWTFDHGVNFCWNDSTNTITGINRRYAVGYVYDGAWDWTGNVNPTTYWFAWHAGFPKSGHYADRTGVFAYGKPPLVLGRSYPKAKIELHDNGTWVGLATCTSC